MSNNRNKTEVPSSFYACTSYGQDSMNIQRGWELVVTEAVIGRLKGESGGGGEKGGGGGASKRRQQGADGMVWCGCRTLKAPSPSVVSCAPPHQKSHLSAPRLFPGIVTKGKFSNVRVGNTR
jgi:hypothetical protein